MTEKTKKIFVALLIAVLIITNINLNSRIHNLESAVQSINTSLLRSIQELHSGQYDISSKIDSIKEQAVQNAKLSFDEVTLIKGYHEASATVDIDVSFSLKQFDAEDVVNVTARGINGETFDAVAFILGAGRFSATLILPVQDNYALSFTALGNTNTSGELANLFLADELCERFKYSCGTGQTNYTITLFPEFFNNTQGNTALKIKEISLIVESGNIVTGTWDLLPYLQDEGNIQSMNVRLDNIDQLRMAAGEVPTSNEEYMSENVIAFPMPDEGAVTRARLVFTDNMGVHYEQTDQIYFSHSSNSSAGGGSGYAYPPARIAEDGVYGDGYIHLVR